MAYEEKWEKTMQKVLLIILEGRSASGICANHIATALRKKSCQVDVLSYTEELENCGDDRDGCGENIHIKPKFFIRKINKFYGKHRLMYNLCRHLYGIQVAVTSLFIWPWNAPLFTLRLYRRVRALQKQKKYDAVVPCYTQIDPLIAGYLLKKHFPSVKYVPCFLDCLSGGPTPRLLTTEKKIKKGLMWEKKLLSNADGIIAMQSSQEHYLRNAADEEFVSKMQFLDIPMLVRPEGIVQKADRTCNKAGGKRRLKLLYVGSLPLSIRNPFYGLELLSHIPDIEVWMVGSIPPSEEYVRFCNNLKCVNLVGAVAHKNVASYMEDADVFLNFGNNIAEMVPSKIFEYMSYGKPILSFSPNSKDASLGYLKRYPTACTIREWEDREQNIAQIKNFLTGMSGENLDFNKICEEFQLNTPECFAEFICSLDGGK